MHCAGREVNIPLQSQQVQPMLTSAGMAAHLHQMHKLTQAGRASQLHQRKKRKQR